MLFAVLSSYKIAPVLPLGLNTTPVAAARLPASLVRGSLWLGEKSDSQGLGLNLDSASCRACSKAGVPGAHFSRCPRLRAALVHQCLALSASQRAQDLSLQAPAKSEPCGLGSVY